jgi:hypothetical protein
MTRTRRAEAVSLGIPAYRDIAATNPNLPCSGGERRILQLSASLAAGTPVSLRDTVTGPRRPQHRPARHSHPARSRKTIRQQQTSTVALTDIYDAERLEA